MKLAEMRSCSEAYVCSGGPKYYRLGVKGFSGRIGGGRYCTCKALKDVIFMQLLTIGGSFAKADVHVGVTQLDSKAVVTEHTYDLMRGRHPTQARYVNACTFRK